MAYSRLEESTSKLILQEKDNLASLISAYNKKYLWINSVIQNKQQSVSTNTHKEIIQALDQLNLIKINSQTDLNNFELWNNKLNQILVKEVIKFNSKQKSIFINISQIRDLERYDRHIDFARSQYSSWSYQFYQAKTEMQKSLFSKNSTLAEIPFYEIDHIILKKKENKQL